MRNTKLKKITSKLEDLHKEWLKERFKSIVGKSKLIERKQRYKNKMVIFTYYVWYENFIDEDNGNVVEIERTSLIKIDGILVESNKKPITYKF